MKLNLTAISETLNEMCEHHAPLEHGSEVAWCLYILRELGLKVENAAATAVATMRDNCSLLLLLEAHASRRIIGPAPSLSTIISRAEDIDAWHTEDWLLAYEAGRHGWANDTAIMVQPNWAELRKLGVGFFSLASIGSVPTTPVSCPPTPTNPTLSTPGPKPPLTGAPNATGPGHLPGQPKPATEDLGSDHSLEEDDVFDSAGGGEYETYE